MWQYEQSLKHYRDMRNVVSTAFEDGKSEGIEEGIEKGREEGIKEGQRSRELEIATELKKNRVPADIISKTTGLPIEVIKNL